MVVDVLLVTLDHAPFIFMYQPVLQTLLAGFRALGANARVLSGHRHIWPHSYRLQRGDLLVWVGIPGSDFRLIRWTHLRSRGVRTAWYNTEPQLDDLTLMPKCHHSYVSMLRSVDEIWDYSLFNLHTCRSLVERYLLNVSAPTAALKHRAAIRYVPPGAMGLNVTSQVARDRRAVFLGILPSNTTHRGNWKTGFLRRRTCFAQLEQRVGRSRLLHVSSIWTLAEMARLLFSHSTFLNIHKWCGAEQIESPAEALRFAPLLSTGARVISERAYGPDEQQYAGLVEFMPWERFADVLSAGNEVESRAGARDLPSQQRTSRANLFGQRFSPTAILRFAGIAPTLVERWDQSHPSTLASTHKQSHHSQAKEHRRFWTFPYKAVTD
ncbi:hypothetical protein AB1Y20_010730 [Prymnesium parvum]|uniref:Uncharacterized protein n=1 Tax=Prymnesium parvum TaxID=97485 RepID=A0AB34IS72_PRYPA